LRWPARWHREKPSRHLGEYILVCKVTARLGKGHDFAPQGFELADAKLATKGLPANLASVLP
jgi:hypothetical protein